MGSVTQLHEVTPEELTASIIKSFDDRIEELKKNFKPKEPETYLTRSQVCELLSISYGCLHAWSNKGIIKALKIGNRTYYSRTAIEETLKNSNR